MIGLLPRQCLGAISVGQTRAIFEIIPGGRGVDYRHCSCTIEVRRLALEVGHAVIIQGSCENLNSEHTKDREDEHNEHHHGRKSGKAVDQCVDQQPNAGHHPNRTQRAQHPNRPEDARVNVWENENEIARADDD